MQKLADELVALIGKEAKGMTSRALVKATGKPTKEVNPRLKDLEHIGTVIKEKMTYHLANAMPPPAPPQQHEEAPPPPPAEPVKAALAASTLPSNGASPTTTSAQDAAACVEPHQVGASS